MPYYCKHCDKKWLHPVKKCIFCGHATIEENETEYVVTGSTQVNIPSRGNEQVPYYCYLLEDGRKNKKIWKSLDAYEIGAVIDIKVVGDKTPNMIIPHA